MAAALLFGTCPLLGEAIGWFSASCNAIGSLLLLIILDLGCRFGSGLLVPDRSDWSRLLAIALLSFATACFYEPAAASLAAMPLVVWIATPRAADLRVRARRIIMATIAAGLPCALYVALLVATAPSGVRGAVDTVGDLDPVHHSLRKFARSFVDTTAGPRGRDIVLGGVEQGIAAVREHPFLLGVVIATACAGMISLIASARTPPPATPIGKKPAAEARGLLLPLGILLMLASWVPFIAQHNTGLPPRSLYVPLLGAAFFVAAVGNEVNRRLVALSERGRGAARAMAAGGVGALAIVGQIGLLGMQTQFRSNARFDAFVAEQLGAMSPDVEPETAFMVLAAEHSEAATSRPGYNSILHTALREGAAATPFLRLSMRRSDVRALTGIHGGRMLVCVNHLSSEGVRDTGIGGEDRFIPWANIVPVWIDAQAKVHFVDTLTIQPLDGSPLEIRPVRAKRLARNAIERAAEGTDNARRRIRLIETTNGNSRIVVDVDQMPTGPKSERAR